MTLLCRTETRTPHRNWHSTGDTPTGGLAASSSTMLGSPLCRPLRGLPSLTSLAHELFSEWWRPVFALLVARALIPITSRAQLLGLGPAQTRQAKKQQRSYFGLSLPCSPIFARLPKPLTVSLTQAHVHACLKNGTSRSSGFADRAQKVPCADDDREVCV